MPFTTWIRDILGIRKDVIDTKRAKLEVERLEDDKRARNLITPATQKDIEQYDYRYRAIRSKLDDEKRKRVARKAGPGCGLTGTMAVISVLLVAFYAICLIQFAGLRLR